MCGTLRSGKVSRQLRSGNVGLRQHERLPGNPHDAFVRPAADSRRQVTHRLARDVYADHGKVPVLKFKNVGAAVERDGVSAVRVEDLNGTRPEATFHLLNYYISYQYNTFRSRLLYCIASNKCGDSILSAPARSAMVRATLRMRS
jgi:hypothetical protein